MTQAYNPREDITNNNTAATIFLVSMGLNPESLHILDIYFCDIYIFYKNSIKYSLFYSNKYDMWCNSSIYPGVVRYIKRKSYEEILEISEKYLVYKEYHDNILIRNPNIVNLMVENVSDGWLDYSKEYI